MIGIGLHIGNRVMGSSGGGGGFDADAQAFFDRVTVAGGTLTTTEKNATNQLVLDMKSAGIWSAMKAIYPMVGASAAACAQNLKSSSFTGTFTSGWTFASTGATPNGTSAFFDTAMNPLTNLTKTSHHISFYSRTQNSSVSGWNIGQAVSPNESNLSVYFAAVAQKGFLPGSYPAQWTFSAVTNTLGLHIGSETSSTSSKLYQNSSLLATNTSSNATVFANLNYYIGATNLSGTTSYFTPHQCAFASIGDGLTDTQASNFYTAVQAFQTTLNRYVDAPWYDNGNLLLDDYPSAAAAYSVRKLRNNYIGGPIRVRRSSDNAEQDIYFDANGNLDTAQLTTFCSGTNGFVTTWYDQSGNGVNATQTTATNQPQIVSSGSVITVNSKPCVQFFSASVNRLVSNLISSSTEVSIISVSRHTPTTNYSPIIGVGLNNGYSLTTQQNKYNLFYRAIADQRTTNDALSTQALIFAYTKSATNQQLFANDVSYQNITPATMNAPTTSSRIGVYDTDTDPYNGTQQELIVYANSQLSNRSGIQTNINTYYAIY